jgi:catechol 2,3-dioxygenase
MKQLLNEIYKVEINVLNHENMLDFYHGFLGFEIIKKTANQTYLGFNNKTILIINDGEYKPKHPETLDLYHIAFLIDSDTSFVAFIRYLIHKKYPITGISDHGVSIAVYFNDPEGNGIEVYFDKDKSQWPYHQGQLEMVTKQVNLDALFKITNHIQAFNSQTMIGHIHLHVSHLEEAKKDFIERFEFKHIQDYMQSASFLSDGDYHHFLGINIWKGTGLSKKNLDEQGLKKYYMYGHKDFKTQDICGFDVEVTKI